MKPMHRLAVAACLILSAGALSAQAGDQRLAKIDAALSIDGTDFVGQYTFTQEVSRKGETAPAVSTKKAVIYRRDSSNSYLLILSEPEADKGKAYLKTDNNLWLYDPVSKRFTFTNAEDRFQNLNIRNSDFSRSSLAKDYKVVGAAKEKLGMFDCDVLSLEAVANTVTFPKLKIWVSPDNLVRKRQDFSLSGELIRTSVMPSYLKVGAFNVPKRVIILDELRGRTIDGKFVNDQTIMVVEAPSLQKLNGSIYTKAYLEQIGR